MCGLLCRKTYFNIMNLFISESRIVYRFFLQRTPASSTSYLQQRSGFSHSILSDRPSLHLSVIRTVEIGNNSGLESSSVRGTNFNSEDHIRMSSDVFERGSEANRPLPASRFSASAEDVDGEGSGSGSLVTSHLTKPCSLCGKKFASGWELKRHINTHIDDRPFKCLYCNHRSNFKHNLKAHVRIVHKDQPFGFTVVPSAGFM